VTYCLRSVGSGKKNGIDYAGKTLASATDVRGLTALSLSGNVNATVRKSVGKTTMSAHVMYR